MRVIPARLSPLLAVLALAAPARAKIDNSHRINVNSLNCVVTNHNSYAYDLITGNAGLEWPKGSGKTAVFAAGLWVGAKVNSATTPTVKVGEYSQEWGPGNLVGGLGAADNSSYHVYQVLASDTSGTSNPDYLNWPVSQGAPTDSRGRPRVYGDMTLWSVWNDRSPLSSTNRAGTDGISPALSLGLEVQQTVFAVSRAGSLNNVIYLFYRLANKGGGSLHQTYVGLWMDPDLGDASDDLVGCDTSLSVGYVYNGSNFDAVYGVAPPALGVELLQGPRDAASHRPLGMTSFTSYVNGDDPASAVQSYYRLQGLLGDGSVLQDPLAHPTRFYYAGDPVAGTGWLDSNPSDHRFMLCSGPFEMAPGDTQLVVAAVAIGRGSSNLASVTALRTAAQDARAAVSTMVTDVPKPSAAPALRLSAPTPNPAGGQVFAALEMSAAGSAEVRVFSAAGCPVATLLAGPLSPGSHRLEWNGRDASGRPVPSGVYWLRAAAAGQSQTRKLVWLR